jgi:30S ribosomal protein S31
MGKGDKKTKRGKINMGTYGKLRPRKSTKTIIVKAKPKKKAAAKTTVKTKAAVKAKAKPKAKAK